MQRTRSEFDLERALREWRTRLGEDRVVVDPATLRQYGTCTTTMGMDPVAVLRPGSVEDVQAIIRIAGATRVGLYPISTGRNWGYGTASPMATDTAIVDLSTWNAIEPIDTVSGLFSLQPGVTQGDLADYLQRHDLPFMVPVSGAGPSASVVGNALERGYGITPIADHFAAVTRVEAVLPNGDIYGSMLDELGGSEVNHAFKWGVGPYTDGLFTQGAFGIVTRLTVTLARRPESVQAFLFELHDDAMLEPAVECVREVLHRLPGIVGGINLMNAYRVLAMNAPHPRKLDPSAGPLFGSNAESAFRQHNIAAWAGLGAIYGTARVVRAARAEIRDALRRRNLKPIFIDQRRLRYATWLGRALAPLGVLRLGELAERLSGALALLNGRPAEVAMPLAYWKAGIPGPNRADPAADGCGLIWYSPLVPASPARVRAFVEFVTEKCLRFGFEPLITLSTLGPQCFDSTVPILFDPRSAEESEKAKACHAALFESGCQLGFVPYRLGLQSMPYAISHAPDAIGLIDTLKRSVDPHGIIAPGRYSS